jgi:type VI secretion system protein ImpK
MELVTQIRAITARCFTAVELLRRVDPNAVHAFARVQEHLMRDLDNTERLAHQAFGAQVAQDIKYALVALADETALRQSGPLRDFWNPRALQLHYFRDNQAGFGFFDRLDEIRADPGRRPALPVYALCLQFGLRGKYEHDEHGGDRQLFALRQSVFAAAAELVDAGKPPLLLTAPRSGLPRKPVTVARPTLWIGVALVLFTAGFYVLARFGLADMSATLLERLQALAIAGSSA